MTHVKFNLANPTYFFIDEPSVTHHPPNLQRVASEAKTSVNPYCPEPLTERGRSRLYFLLTLNRYRLCYLDLRNFNIE